MSKLSFITLLALFVAVNVFSQSSPHGDKLTTRCDVCHISKNWTTIVIKKDSFDHNKTGFPLVGQHQTASCKKCHQDLIFSHAKGKNECKSCHTDVHQQTLGNDCERCHTPSTWKVENITQIHNQSRFPLHGSHAQLDCQQCHKSASLLRFDAMGTACVDCHDKDYFATTNPSHVASKFPKDCFMCHNENTWKTATFNHDNTGFPLKGGHIGLDCIQCHAKGYAGTPTTCVSCHLTNYNASTNPNHISAKFSTDCITCHNVTAWSPSTFNHNTATTFPLTGAHIGVACVSCHTNGYGAIPTTCVSCHLTNYNATTNPNHKTAKFSTDCITCHTVTGWSPSTFNHNTATTFPLTGAHTGVACVSCHTNGYGAIPTTCVSCHLTNYNATTNPNHKTAKFSTDCITCHNVTTWSPSTFNHNTATTFPLTGSHIGVSCVSCHPNGYSAIPTTCVSCHLTNYNSTTNPNHIAAKFSTDCITCHNVTTWSPSTFNHSTATTFPLTGAHIGVACVSCHPTGYSAIPTTCVSCHLTNYNSTTNPNHIAAKFSTDCKTCHNVTAWSPSTFNHSTATTFPLTGAHIGVSCVSCHPNGYSAIPTTCVSCHLTNYNSTTNPNHIAAKFSTDCKTCHNVTAWSPSTFNHSTATTFPLTGAHIGVSCVSCHPTGYSAIPTTCVSCHLTNYNSTTNPNHIAAKFSTDCKTCHNVTAWSPSTFNHSTATTFPLTGAHIGVACVSCHPNGYSAIPTTCVSCHLTNYNATTNPNHIAAKFPTTCETCHTNTAWQPSTFNHTTSTTFPLTGAHVGVACQSCHTNGYTGGTPTTCVGCHQANYNATTNPNHLTAKFPTTCETCHTNTSWQPSTFNHTTSTTFPLTGAHVGVACQSCHTNGYTGGTPATCVGCHLTNYNTATNPNHVTNNFSKDCQLCHNNTAWQPSTFNHNTTVFPLTGAHTGVACVSCHTNGYTGGTPTTCVGCHLTNFNASTNPNHVLAKFSTDCKTCHTVTAWSPATFNHNTATSFPLAGAHIGVACISCHAAGYAGIPTTCVSCHQTNYNATTNPNHITAKFPTTCETCHTVSGWVPSTFNHSTSTTFPLTGSHTGVACVSCHPTGYTAIPTTCVSCHLANYNSTTNPNHVTAKFATTCQTCHTTTAWVPSTFNHSTATTFPLTGAHIGVACVSCHPNGYSAIPTTCVSCHLTTYNATTNPNHVTSKFPTTCETCHSTSNWTSSTFNHSTSTTFPLTGAHIGLTCIQCHPTNYNAIPTTCVSCHLATYNATTNPNHIGAKFATTCQTCHTTTNWTSATFNHNTVATIPLTGNHNLACSVCHTTPTNYAVFSCRQTGCHANAHNASAGSTGCYSCHPRGRAG